mmetsp:Transcript_26989/g.70971  ORF Transcript_26989/g.70971 Transcript_26989/m.70971 type:complete len:259 (-) Transcript_26989:86-862(-)
MEGSHHPLLCVRSLLVAKTRLEAGRRGLEACGGLETCRLKACHRGLESCRRLETSSVRTTRPHHLLYSGSILLGRRSTESQQVRRSQHGDASGFKGCQVGSCVRHLLRCRNWRSDGLRQHLHAGGLRRNGAVDGEPHADDPIRQAGEVAVPEAQKEPCGSRGEGRETRRDGEHREANEEGAHHHVRHHVVGREREQLPNVLTKELPLSNSQVHHLMRGLLRLSRVVLISVGIVVVGRVRVHPRARRASGQHTAEHHRY